MKVKDFLDWFSFTYTQYRDNRKNAGDPNYVRWLICHENYYVMIKHYGRWLPMNEDVPVDAAIDEWTSVIREKFVMIFRGPGFTLSASATCEIKDGKRCFHNHAWIKAPTEEQLAIVKLMIEQKEPD